MRPFGVVVLDVLADQVVDVPLAADDEVVRALLLLRLDEPLDIRLQIR